MKNKDKTTKIIIIAVIAVILAVALLKLPSLKPAGVQDKGVSLKVLFYDENKNPITSGSGLQSTANFPGVPSEYGVTWVRLESTITADVISDVEVQVNDITGTNTPGTNLYGPSLAAYTKNFILQPGQANTQTSDFIDLRQLELGDVEFRMDVDASYLDAMGNPVDASTYGTIIGNIIADVCPDGTPEGQCSQTSGSYGKYCNDGILVDNAVSCGCCYGSLGPEPCGWEPGADPNVCVEITCSGAPTGECIASTLNTYFPKYCELDGTSTDACNRCNTCKNDNYNNPSTGCSDTVDPATCTYQTYGASLSMIVLPEGYTEVVNVLFRTSDLNYGTNSAVAFSTACTGGTLTTYGKNEGSKDVTKNCGSDASPYMVPTSSGTIKMWVINSGNLAICTPGDTNPTYYQTSDPDASNVVATGTSVVPNMELPC